jgi:hypothetical protein
MLLMLLFQVANQKVVSEHLWALISISGVPGANVAWRQAGYYDCSFSPFPRLLQANDNTTLQATIASRHTLSKLITILSFNATDQFPNLFGHGTRWDLKHTDGTQEGPVK